MSGHGRAHSLKESKVSYCTDCHGGHGAKSHYDELSPTYRANIPTLCGGCHKKDGKAATVPGLKAVNVFFDYSRSVHGKGLVEKGLLPSAVCTDCHNSHFILKENDERSSVNARNIPATCGKCHRGIFRKYEKSIHSISFSKSRSENLPTCAQCHSAHGIAETEQDDFLTEVTQTCGRCHSELAKSYLETMHGKAYQLGYLKSAKCSDCHEPHSILSVNDPESSVGPRKIITTCRKCHQDANRRFTGYLTHATHHDRVKFPVLYFTFWAMTALLVSVFVFFGLHTALWLPRSIQGLRAKRRAMKAMKGARSELLGRIFVSRFTPGQRLTHVFVIISFIGLALTGMILKFSGMGWARFLASLIGGVAVAGNVHRICAVVTFGYFTIHLGSLVRMKMRRKLSWGKLIFGPDSLMFNVQDLKDFWATIRWFVGLGPRPAYGHWTYWEKFDYFAVFWGVAIIGLSGLMLWFPEVFTLILPGWLINVAQIVHSDEALLAVGFIFTIHFFNTHLRPEVFPMDTVIFSGWTSLEEYRAFRPREYEEMKKSGQLRKRVSRRRLNPTWERTMKTFGAVFLTLGLALVVLIIYSMLFGYK